jgi:hypothetical protein
MEGTVASLLTFPSFPSFPRSRYGTSSDFGSTRTIQRPELMSGT